MLITEVYKEKIMGTLHCYDRINIKGTVGMFGYADGMRMFFNMIKRRCFDFAKVFEPVTQAIIRIQDC